MGSGEWSHLGTVMGTRRHWQGVMYALDLFSHFLEGRSGSFSSFGVCFDGDD